MLCKLMRNDSRLFQLSVVILVIVLYISVISNDNGKCLAYINSSSSAMISQKKQGVNNSNQTVSSSCPYMIYGKHWRKYLYSPESKNHYSTSTLDRLANIYIPLYNQTEWSKRFEEQPNPLSCPGLYFQVSDGPMLSFFDPEEDAAYQRGDKSYVCEEIDFKDNIADVCDQLLCFSPEERASLFNQDRKFGINLTALIPTSLEDIEKDEFFGKRLTLFFVSKYIESIESRKLIDKNDDFISDEYNALLNQMIPLFNHNFTYGFELVDVFLACRACRDYSKDPVKDNRDVCMAIDYPFSCESSEATEEDLEGVPLSSVVPLLQYTMAGDANLFVTGFSLCFCPSRATIVGQGTDVNITQDHSIIRIATKCDYYNDLWYPAYESAIIRKVYLAFEALVFVIATVLICIPLTIQGIMEVIMKISKSNFEIPKLHKAFRKRGPKRINKVLRKGVYFYKNNASSVVGKSWMRLLFNIRFISAITLFWGSISFLVENAAFLDTGFSIHSIHLILNGYSGYYTSLLFVLALWIDTMIRVEKNSHSISLVIVIPLAVIMFLILTCSLVFVSFDLTIQLFYGIMIFYACTTFMFVMIMILLVIYGAKIFIRLKVPLFQFKITKFLILLLLFGVPTVLFMIFYLVQRLALSQTGYWISTRFFSYFLHDVISICFTGLGFAVSYALYPSNKVVLESYNTLIYLFLCMICVGKRIKRFLKDRELAILREVFVNNSFQSTIQAEHVDISEFTPQPLPASSSIENERLTEGSYDVSYSRLE